MSDLSPTGLAARFAKTEVGRAEIRAKVLPLSRPARNLLLIIDTTRTGEGWLAMVQGSTPADLHALLQAGLVAPGMAGTGGSGAAGASTGGAGTGGSGTGGSSTGGAGIGTPAADAAPRMSLAQALAARSYKTLYDRITAEARPRLGLIKGYKLILEVERCNGPAEIRALAQRFVEQVRDNNGDAAGVAIAQVLLAPE